VVFNTIGDRPSVRVVSGRWRLDYRDGGVKIPGYACVYGQTGAGEMEKDSDEKNSVRCLVCDMCSALMK
jgi:hypothetical protein